MSYKVREYDEADSDLIDEVHDLPAAVTLYPL
jgi:hypothetical protein